MQRSACAGADDERQHDVDAVNGELTATRFRQGRCATHLCPVSEKSTTRAAW